MLLLGLLSFKMMTMKSKTLLDLLPVFTNDFPASFNLTQVVAGVTDDSRKVMPGFVFVAYSGDSSDGHKYIETAQKNGAILVVGDKPAQQLWLPNYVQVENSRKMLAHLAAAFYGHPAHHLTVIGVTGTDGKTTTANLIYAILRHAGIKAGLISTVNAVIGDQVLDTGFHVTTPDAPAVQQYLAKMVESGLTHVVLETTSHGWAQYRVDACEFDIGTVTNITHEHLDYHKTYQNYLQAKARLLESLSITKPKSSGQIGLAVINRDDASYEALSQVGVPWAVSYGFKLGSTVLASDYTATEAGIYFKVKLEDSETELTVPLYGKYNVSNCLAAIATSVYGLEVPLQTATQALSRFGGIPGRMQRFSLGQNFLAFVDFAHTPNALAVTLQTAQQIRQSMVSAGKPAGRVIAVFGSAGLRDREKRRLMAEVAAKNADVTILTAEDPRTEDLGAILSEMSAAAISNGAEEGKSLFSIQDRPSAIRFAVRLATEGDIVLCCGKGHEQSMCFGTVEYAWDDAAGLQAALAELLGKNGPAMPLLPTTPGFTARP